MNSKVVVITCASGRQCVIGPFEGTRLALVYTRWLLKEAYADYLKRGGKLTYLQETIDDVFANGTIDDVKYNYLRVTEAVDIDIRVLHAPKVEVS